MVSSNPDDDTRAFRDDLLALRAFARSRMSAEMLAKESPSDVVQAVCEDLLRNSTATPALGDDGPQRIQRLRQLITFKIRERRRYWSRKKRTGNEVAGVADEQAMRGKGPESLAVLREWLISVRRDIGHLPPRQQEAVRLFYLEGRSMRELGAAIGCTEAAAKMLVARAVRTLRAADSEA